MTDYPGLDLHMLMLALLMTAMKGEQTTAEVGWAVVVQSMTGRGTLFARSRTC